MPSSSASALGRLLSIHPTKPNPSNDTPRYTEANSPRSIGSGSSGGILRRRQLADRRSEYGPQNDICDVARTRPGNRDCLVRVYLGSRRQGAIRRSEWFFSLRNLRLRLNQMEEMGMANEEVLAAQVAGALATMHWKARVDGRGVEFVLGSVPPGMARLKPLTAAELEGLEPGSDTEALVQKRAAVCLWLLDFDQCGNMSMDDKGVERAVEAFCENDPYYPRPVVGGGDGDGKDARLWKGFCARYLEISDRILSGTALPRLMLESIEAHYREEARLKSAEAEVR
ncbi:hypothetical protein DIS24_g9674 [Lasiodiplodia hormozganensis]|uniref:DUF3669 domain-containing protein n=1 Tax=Lasiodiplodia hormozganensis TaxID=869390 RepID=A0AA39XTV1_9PEZI|nr:hypothetical protein DIS24_g9674 [Lasiodiplodia hormozganensis]